MKGHSAHRHVFAFEFAAFGQGDIQRFGGLYRIVKKHFIKIAHAIKQEIARVGFFGLKVLCHHRRQNGCFSFCHSLLLPFDI